VALVHAPVELLHVESPEFWLLWQQDDKDSVEHACFLLQHDSDFF
jgi:hypothetical protein